MKDTNILKELIKRVEVDTKKQLENISQINKDILMDFRGYLENSYVKSDLNSYLELMQTIILLSHYNNENVNHLKDDLQELLDIAQELQNNLRDMTNSIYDVFDYIDTTV